MPTATRRRYEILYPIGKGAFGTVYRGRVLGDGGFTKDVAIKLLRSDLEDAEDFAARQRDEARLLGLIHHRAIVQVDGLVRLDGRWAVVMEYIDGVDLRQIRKRADIPVACAVAVVREVAGALKVASSARKLVHRDIKPSNITITRAGEVKLLDFGSAKARFDQREARTVNLVLGTPHYMAPERYKGVDGPAGDVFALGAVLGELVNGDRLPRPPMKSSSFPKYLDGVRDQLVAKGVHAEVARLVTDCLVADPEARPSAGEIATRAWELERELSGPRLETWAHGVVDRVQEELGHERAALPEPMVLEESDDTPAPELVPPPPPAAAPRRLGTSTAATLGAAGMLGLLLMLAGGALVLVVLFVALLGGG
ncbi:MAG: serine/threonine protein kinase [Myxococcales bacterium]|nr:serine/threonine protein kinase [Myxococcales bacterium]